MDLSKKEEKKKRTRKNREEGCGIANPLRPLESDKPHLLATNYPHCPSSPDSQTGDVR